MRTLFASERRCVFNLFQMKWNGRIHSAPLVLTETIAEPANPRQKPWFNCDFILDFVDWRTFKSERSAAACSVLPNALGAELFLIVEKATLSPTALELNGGGAFPIEYYASYLDTVEAAIREAVELREGRQTGLPWHEMVGAASMKRAAFARLLVVGSDATFLHFRGETAPRMRGERFNLVQRDDREIDCYLDGDEVVCFDGWIRAEVTPTERTLVALPERNPDESGRSGCA